MNDLSPATYCATGARDVAVEPGGEPGTLLTLFSIGKSTRAFLTVLLADLGLYPGQDQLLGRLERDRPISVSVLADQLSVRPSTVSKMLDRLIEKDLVRRATSDGDARRTMVVITEGGLAMQASVHALWRRLEAELLAAIPAEDRASIAEALTSVDRALTVRLRRLR